MFRKKDKEKQKVEYIPEILSLNVIKELRLSPIEKIYAIFLKKDSSISSGYSPILAFEYGSGNENHIFEENYIPKQVPILNSTLNADAIVIVHNHPKINGKIAKAYPSKEDVISTIQSGEMWEKEGCLLLDHIIINKLDHYSFIENGLITIYN